MQITIFGANGRVGRLVVAEALKRNFVVVAFVHGNSPFENQDNLQVITGDIYNKNDVMTAVQGSSAIISALGSWGTSKKNILSEGMKNIIPAMQTSGISRIISLTGSGCKSNLDHRSFKQFFNRMPLMIIAPKVLWDAEKHIELLEISDLDWTILRSPVMNNKGNPDKFNFVANVPMPLAKINRKSVATAMINLLENENYSKKSIFITKT